MQRSLPILILLISLLISGVQPAFAQTSEVQEVSTPPKKTPKPQLEFSLKGGFYEDEVAVELYCPGARIHYTLDGSTPSRRSKRYKESFVFTKTTVIRALAYTRNGKSKIVSHTYFINEPASAFPVVSVAIDPDVLFDPERGLYMKGPNAVDSLWTKDGANFWSRREVRINTEIYENDQTCEFNSVAGFRLFGGVSRLFPQKSMVLVTRDRYGKKRIKHDIFGKEGADKFKFLVLRNSGSDWGKSHFRDAFMTSLLDGWDIDKQDSRPSHVYINGKYWGLYNIREKVNRYFLNSHHEIDKDSVDLIEHRLSRKRGSRRHYVKLLNYLKKNDLSDPNHYAHIASQMEIENFMDFQIAQIYLDNRDAGGNIKFWRPQTDQGRWRWILYDTDWGFGLHESDAYRYNTLEFHTNPNGPDWPNPPWSTFILRKLLENSQFRAAFVNRFADRLNTSFDAQLVLDKLEQYYRMYKPEMPRHFDRWRLSETRWEEHIDIMRDFARYRPEHMRDHLAAYFRTGAAVPVGASVSEGGKVVINHNLQITAGHDFRGYYFEHFPIHVKAVPRFGYRFSHWEGIAAGSDLLELDLKLKEGSPLILRAVFEPAVHPLADRVLINEVSANNKKSGDWIELYNHSDETVTLDKWILTDNKKEYRIPTVAIPAKGYVIVCEDSLSFRKEHTDPFLKVVGNLPFGLNKRRETLALYTGNGESVDSIYYHLEPTDSTFALGLLLPQLDNGDNENWEVNWGKGTPGAPNPYYLESHIKAEQEMWVRIGVGVGILLCCVLMVRMRRRDEKVALVNKEN